MGKCYIGCLIHEVRRPMHELTPSEVAMAESTASSVCTTNFQVSWFHFMFLKDF